MVAKELITSPSSSADGSTNRDNPLYEEQEIRMEMFASDSDESDDGMSRSVGLLIYMGCLLLGVNTTYRVSACLSCLLRVKG